MANDTVAERDVNLNLPQKFVVELEPSRKMITSEETLIFVSFFLPKLNK